MVRLTIFSESKYVNSHKPSILTGLLNKKCYFYVQFVANSSSCAVFIDVVVVVAVVVVVVVVFACARICCVRAYYYGDTEAIYCKSGFHIVRQQTHLIRLRLLVFHTNAQFFLLLTIRLFALFFFTIRILSIKTSPLG